MDSIRQQQVREEMSEPPNEEELLAACAVMKLRMGRQLGSKGYCRRW